MFWLGKSRRGVHPFWETFVNEQMENGSALTMFWSDDTIHLKVLMRLINTFFYLEIKHGPTSVRHRIYLKSKFGCKTGAYEVLVLHVLEYANATCMKPARLNFRIPRISARFSMLLLITHGCPEIWHPNLWTLRLLLWLSIKGLINLLLSLKYP